MASITDPAAMQVVTFRLQSGLYDDAKERARQLGFTTISQYLRSLINMDVHGTKMFDKVSPDPDGQDQTAANEDISEPPTEQSDPQGDPVPAE